MMVTMRGRAFLVAVVVLAAGAVLVNVYAQILTRELRPFTPFADLVISGTAGVIFAGCGVAAARWDATLPSLLLVAGSYVWTFGVFSTALQPTSSWWVLFYALAPALGSIVILLIITYPTGTISGFSGWAVLIGTVAFLATQALIIVLAETGEWCLCAPNPFIALPRGVAVAWYDIRLVAGAVLSVGAVAVLIARWIRGTRPWRVSNVFMTVTGVALAVTTVWSNVADLTTLSDEREGWAYVRIGLVVAVALAWVAGLAIFRQARARVADVVLAARDGVTPARWDQLIQAALDDRSARVIWRDGAVYRSASGELVVPREGAAAVAGEEGGPPAAWIEFDPALSVKRELLDSLAVSVGVFTRNESLTADLARSIRDVRESRARLVDAADDARRRIERDLHDGAQQLLLTASLSLDRAREGVDGDDRALATQQLDRATEELRLARRELRELARGITPVILDHGGLTGAIEELALRSPVPTSVHVRGESRDVDDVVATTLYFTVAESLTNVGKHAHASSAHIDLTFDEGVGVRITDDGDGGARMTAAGGLRGLSDRIEAVGGVFRVGVAAGRGSVVSAQLADRAVKM